MDQVVLAYSQDTRGTYIPGISHYLLGDYRGAMELLSEQYTLDKDNKLIQIYLLLSSLELDRQQEVLEMLGPEHRPAKDVLDQSLCWYSTLALIKSDRREAALERLNPLTEQEGPYQSDAIRLEKVLLK